MRAIDVDTLLKNNDALLEPLLRAGSAEAREEAIERLVVDHARPLIRRIVARYAGNASLLPPQEVEDIEATLSLRLVSKLQDAAAADVAIRNFEDYVATLTYNAVNDVLRRRHPERTRLKNRLRYIVTHDRRLALWRTPNGLVAGLASDEGAAGVPSEPRLDAATPAMLDGARTAEALHAILGRTGPMLFDALVALAATLWNVGEAAPAPRPESAPDAEPIARFETRDFVRALWREILLLRPRQRKVLLLNLRDRETVNVMSLIALTGIATIDEIAAAMEMTREELAAIWNDLPLDDLRIAGMMGVTRQQVINLRKAARERLGNRLLRPKTREP